jgi:ATP-dependent protease ClpP protease subunit
MIMVERTGMAEANAGVVMESEKPISATEAAALGIVHEVVGRTQALSGVQDREPAT